MQNNYSCFQFPNYVNVIVQDKYTTALNKLLIVTIIIICLFE